MISFKELESTLLSCPFCGEAPHLYGDNDSFYMFLEICCFCGIAGIETCYGQQLKLKTEDEAFEYLKNKWNTRYPLTCYTNLITYKL